MSRKKNFDIDAIFDLFRKREGSFETQFAPNDRLGQAKIEKQLALFISSMQGETEIRELLDKLSFPILLLNDNRQIIYANRSFLVLISRQLKEIQGLRLGEAVGCTHAMNGEYGCGSNIQCSQCPAVNGMLASLDHLNQSQVECAITTASNDSLELELNFNSWQVDNETYLLTTAEDIREKNHREMLERTVLHDIQNTSGALNAFAEEFLSLVQEASNPRLLSLAKMIRHISTIVTDELVAHSQLVNLEVNSLRINISSVKLDEFIPEIVDLYSTFPWARNSYFIKQATTKDISILTDPVILKRVIVNLLKNAAEAEIEYDKSPITINWGSDREQAFISIHNNAAIPQEIQYQLFRKYSSTKGKGRGIGTYSVKVLVENYLNAKVSFHSSPETGTTFSVFFPLQ